MFKFFEPTKARCGGEDMPSGRIHDGDDERRLTPWEVDGWTSTTRRRFGLLFWTTRAAYARVKANINDMETEAGDWFWLFLSQFLELTMLAFAVVTKIRE